MGEAKQRATSVAGAQLAVNGKPVASATKLAVDDRIEIGHRTLIIRAESFMPASPGPDPSCPGFADQLWIQDRCAMYGTSFSQLLGGDEMIVGTDRPERSLRGYQPAVQVRVRLVNHAGSVEFTALDPKHPPKVKGTPMVHGKLEAGSVIAVGDRVFAIAKDDRSKAIIESPATSCPEAKQKATRRQR